MGALPQNYLSKKGGRYRKVKLLDIVTLLHNMYAGARHPKVGFEDAHETTNTILRRLNKKVLIDPTILESLLWSCNLLDERGKFWDAKGRTFDDFVTQLGIKKFDKRYNLIGDSE